MIGLGYEKNEMRVPARAQVHFQSGQIGLDISADLEKCLGFHLAAAFRILCIRQSQIELQLVATHISDAACLIYISAS